MIQLIPLPFPVAPPFWTIGGFAVTREVLRSRIGAPHFVETDDLRTYGGDEDWWGFTTEDGQRLLICLQVPYRDAAVFADPPDFVRAEAALTRAIGDSEYRRDEPQLWPL